MSRIPKSVGTSKPEQVLADGMPEPDFSAYDSAVTLATAEVSRIRDELKKARDNSKKTWRSEGEKDRYALQVVTLERGLIGAQRTEKLARAARARAMLAE